MNRDVTITVRGYRKADDQEETTEVTCPAEYFDKGGTRYIKYDEMVEGVDEITHNMVKIKDGRVEVTRRGGVNTQLTFEEGGYDCVSYHSPFGLLTMGHSVKRLLIVEKKTALCILAEYVMDLDGEPYADCALEIIVKEKQM